MEEENLTQNTTAPVEEKKGLSIGSLVLGIVALVTMCFIPYISILCAIDAIVLGVIGRKKGGKGMGTAGLVLGIISLVLVIIIIILAAVGIGMLATMDPSMLNELSTY